jgi:hypothetical protein
MRVVMLSLRYRSAWRTIKRLQGIYSSGTAYLTDSLYQWLPHGGRRLYYPGGRDGWQEVERDTPDQLIDAEGANPRDAPSFCQPLDKGWSAIFVRHT